MNSCIASSKLEYLTFEEWFDSYTEYSSHHERSHAKTARHRHRDSQQLNSLCGGKSNRQCNKRYDENIINAIEEEILKRKKICKSKPNNKNSSNYHKQKKEQILFTDKNPEKNEPTTESFAREFVAGKRHRSQNEYWTSTANTALHRFSFPSRSSSPRSILHSLRIETEATPLWESPGTPPSSFRYHRRSHPDQLHSFNSSHSSNNCNVDRCQGSPTVTQQNNIPLNNDSKWTRVNDGKEAKDTKINPEPKEVIINSKKLRKHLLQQTRVIKHHSPRDHEKIEKT
eukprot:gb/GECH01010380.1/.p1 GENE.gb/GECH01010380.1/~~gb/GECH01010380.1/.p1  ORF type:complete len:285 (+),score=40.16 gb/GECH01010380.1/:1-855(+)